MLNDYEAAAVRSWAVDHARRIHSTRIPNIDDLIEDAKRIESYLTGRGTASLTTIQGQHGKLK